MAVLTKHYCQKSFKKYSNACNFVRKLMDQHCNDFELIIDTDDESETSWNVVYLAREEKTDE